MGRDGIQTKLVVIAINGSKYSTQTGYERLYG